MEEKHRVAPGRRVLEAGSAGALPGAARVRLAFAFLIALLCGGCGADLLRSAAPEPQQAAVVANDAPIVEEPHKFRCSDGTISNSQYDCLVAMAKARLPPSQTGQAQRGCEHKPAPLIVIAQPPRMSRHLMNNRPQLAHEFNSRYPAAVHGGLAFQGIFGLS
jgi:hypothetical protein